jgi:hypothetical protein
VTTSRFWSCIQIRLFLFGCDCISCKSDRVALPLNNLFEYSYSKRNNSASHQYLFNSSKRNLYRYIYLGEHHFPRIGGKLSRKLLFAKISRYISASSDFRGTGGSKERVRLFVFLQIAQQVVVRSGEKMRKEKVPADMEHESVFRIDGWVKLQLTKMSCTFSAQIAYF